VGEHGAHGAHHATHTTTVRKTLAVGDVINTEATRLLDTLRVLEAVVVEVEVEVPEHQAPGTRWRATGSGHQAAGIRQRASATHTAN
jgi:hypothetical protein